MLKKMGIANLVASENGQMAYEKLNFNKPNLIISDWNIPEMNGLEFYKTAKKKGLIDNTPFLMVTVGGERKKVLEAVGAGIQYYIVKPLSPKIFEHKVRPLLNI